MWAFLIGFISMAGFLAVLGITRARSTSVLGWTAAWTAASVAYAGLLVAVFVSGDPIATEATQGASLGYVSAVAFHTLHHAREGQPG